MRSPHGEHGFGETLWSCGADAQHFGLRVLEEGISKAEQPNESKVDHNIRSLLSCRIAKTRPAPAATRESESDRTERARCRVCSNRCVAGNHSASEAVEDCVGTSSPPSTSNAKSGGSGRRCAGTRGSRRRKLARLSSCGVLLGRKDQRTQRCSRQSSDLHR